MVSSEPEDFAFPLRLNTAGFFFNVFLLLFCGITPDDFISSIVEEGYEILKYFQESLLGYKLASFFRQSGASRFTYCVLCVRVSKKTETHLP